MTSSAPPVRPMLNDVTLVAATSIAIPATVRALERSLDQAGFERVLLLSDRPPEGYDQLADRRAVEWQPIAPLRSKIDYSLFMLRRLADYVTTRHALCIQWDGYVLNGAAWSPHFLDYDYIGAVWPHFSDGKSVGNGGFSLRSRKLLEACRHLPFDGLLPEDVVIGRLHREELEQGGIRFAPEPVARGFAYERTAPDGLEFGFHGAFNLVRHLSHDEALELFRSLEPQALTRDEHLELLRWALRRGHARLAFAIALRLRGKLFMLD